MKTLKPFSFDTVLKTSDALDDKIDLLIGRWTFQTSEEGLKAFKFFLGSPSKHDKGAPFFGTSSTHPHGWFFLAAETSGPNWNKLLIRTTPLENPETKKRYAPLCAGSLKFSADSDNPSKSFKKWHLTLDLKINALRYIRHQSKSSIPTQPFDLLTKKARIIEREDDRSYSGFEFCWNKEDNWIPDTAYWRKETSFIKRREHLNRYINAILAFVWKEIQRASNHVKATDETMILQPRSPYHSLGRVETAWEFASEDPIRDAYHMANALMNLRRKEAYLNLRDMVNGHRRFNSPSFSIELWRNVSLHVYPKTNQRIRLEVVQKAIWDLPKKDRQKFEKPEGLFEFIDLIRKKATAYINDAIQQMASEAKAKTRPLSALELVSEVSMALPDDLKGKQRLSMLKSIVTMLVYNRGYRGSVKYGVIGPIIKKLKERGVVETSKKRQFYTLTDPYKAVARTITNQGDDPMIAFLGGVRYIRDR